MFKCSRVSRRVPPQEHHFDDGFVTLYDVDLHAVCCHQPVPVMKNVSNHARVFSKSVEIGIGRRICLQGQRVRSGQLRTALFCGLLAFRAAVEVQFSNVFKRINASV